MAESMYKDRSGAWMLRVYAGRDPLTGKKVWKARGFPWLEAGRRAALAALVTEVSSSRPTAASPTFGDLVERWCEAGVAAPPRVEVGYTERYPRGPGEILPEGHDRCLYRFDKPPFVDGAQFAFAIGILPHGLLSVPVDGKAFA